ncbi:MAG: CDP-alcohol phosphatidyltransferase family protein [Candidatus Brocadiales bacterium]
MSLANIVTALRILLTPLLIVILIKASGEDSFRYLAAAMLFFMGMSDGLDGYLAKTRNEVTRLGKYLDPVADKVLVLSLCVLLASSLWPEPRLPVWLAVIIVGREAFIFFGSLALYYQVADWQPCPNVISKVNNVVQLVMFGMVIVNNVMPFPIVSAFLWAVAFLTLASWISYLRLGIGFLTAGRGMTPTT